MLGRVVGLGVGLEVRAPTSKETRAAAANCCSGCGCWRARLNQGRLLTRRPCLPATQLTGLLGNIMHARGYLGVEAQVAQNMHGPSTQHHFLLRK